MLGTLPAALPSPAVAQTLCSEPVEPICANTVPATDPNDATDQRVARNRCLDDMENYRTKLDAFRGCLDASVAEATRNLKDTDALIRCLEGEQPDCRPDDLHRSRYRPPSRPAATHSPAPHPPGPTRPTPDSETRN